MVSRAAFPVAGSGPPLSVALSLTRATSRLLARLAVLEAQLDAGDASGWPAYLTTLDVLLRLAPATAPGAGGELLTTKEMAERLGLAPKTLLKHAKTGAIRPEVRRGKLVRWRGTEALR
jgi:hypothetical protein